MGEIKRQAIFDRTGAPIPQNVMAYIGDMGVSAGGGYPTGSYAETIAVGAHTLIVRTQAFAISAAAAALPNITSLSVSDATVASDGLSDDEIRQPSFLVSNVPNVSKVSGVKSVIFSKNITYPALHSNTKKCMATHMKE